MYDNYVRMKVEGLTKGGNLRDACIIVLREKDNKRLYPVPLTDEDFAKIAAALKHADFTPSRLMSKLASRMGMLLMGVRVMKPQGGQTEALIDFNYLDELVSISAPIADGIVCALENHADIWIGKQLFEMQPPIQEDGDGYRMAIPLDAINNELIEEAIKGAVKSENYELAGKLRDELEKRKRREATGNKETPSEKLTTEKGSLPADSGVQE